jgi:hypothetical protein
MQTCANRRAISRAALGLIGDLVIRTGASNVPEPRDENHATIIINALFCLAHELGEALGPSRRQRREIVRAGLRDGIVYAIPATALDADMLLFHRDITWPCPFECRRSTVGV